jgi:hypothetical protein
MLKVFTCRDHVTHWVGGASIVIAEDESEARRLLIAKLATHGLTQAQEPFGLIEIDLTVPRAIVLQNGDY